MDDTRTRPGPAAFVETPSAFFCAGCGTEVGLGRCESCGAVRQAGDYKVLKLLNESDHARVYLAEGPGGERVALKELIYARAPDAQTIEAFEREAALLREVSHPAIPRFVASFREGRGVGTRLYLAQEFVEGQSLADKLATHRFHQREAVELARSMLEILSYLHGLSPPLVHRDVKPANLIIRPDGTIALVDFGSAREVAPRGTHRATVTGTFGYMPPEALGGTLDRSADLYGVGATLVNLLSRKAPEELLWERPPEALADALNVSPGLVAFIQSLTARDRASRLASAKDALAALSAATDSPVVAAPVVIAKAAAHLHEQPAAAEAPIFDSILKPKRQWKITGSHWVTGVLLSLAMTVSVLFSNRTTPAVRARAPVEEGPPAQRPEVVQPRGEYGTLAVVVPNRSHVWLNGVRVSRGIDGVSLRWRTNLPLHMRSGTVRVESTKGQFTELQYEVQGNEVVITASNPKGTVQVDGVDQGANAYFTVPSIGKEVRYKLDGQMQKPVLLQYHPPKS